ncbi:hypothetical protein K438DRAFT_12986 [Mycena galopus ATCC 62051]|nr:hypothetical protein K438DRAFT_12986 [Mycena galopus ATCC 62051]
MRTGCTLPTAILINIVSACLSTGNYCSRCLDPRCFSDGSASVTVCVLVRNMHYDFASSEEMPSKIRCPKKRLATQFGGYNFGLSIGILSQMCPPRQRYAPRNAQGFSCCAPSHQ